MRCETFVVGPPRGRGPAGTAPEIPRGRLLRDRLIMRLLAVERVIRATIFMLLAIGWRRCVVRRSGCSSPLSVSCR